MDMMFDILSRPVDVVVITTKINLLSCKNQTRNSATDTCNMEVANRLFVHEFDLSMISLLVRLI